jgi:KRAB domain-containing zinc finger protein
MDRQTHTGDKPYMCSICDKRYARMSDLKVHLRSHTGERPYTCTQCKKNYITSSHLRMHERTHNAGVSCQTKKRR